MFLGKAWKAGGYKTGNSCGMMRYLFSFSNNGRNWSPVEGTSRSGGSQLWRVPSSREALGWISLISPDAITFLYPLPRVSSSQTSLLQTAFCSWKCVLELRGLGSNCLTGSFLPLPQPSSNLKQLLWAPNSWLWNRDLDRISHSTDSAHTEVLAQRIHSF